MTTSISSKANKCGLKLYSRCSVIKKTKRDKKKYQVENNEALVKTMIYLLYHGKKCK